MTVLYFIIFPLATILISIVLQRVLKSPVLVALLVFTVFLILAFTVFTSEFLINAIVYSIIAFITAVIFNLICCLKRKLNFNNCNMFNICGDSNGENDNSDLQEDIAGLEKSIGRLEKSIDSLENNIDTLSDIISRLLNNNNNSCGCNRRLNR